MIDYRLEIFASSPHLISTRDVYFLPLLLDFWPLLYKLPMEYYKTVPAWKILAMPDLSFITPAIQMKKICPGWPIGPWRRMANTRSGAKLSHLAQPRASSYSWPPDFWAKKCLCLCMSVRFFVIICLTPLWQ